MQPLLASITASSGPELTCQEGQGQQGDGGGAHTVADRGSGAHRQWFADRARQGAMWLCVVHWRACSPGASSFGVCDAKLIAGVARSWAVLPCGR